LNNFLRALRFIGLTVIVFLSLTTAFIYFYSGQIKNILISELDKNIKEEVTVKIENVHLTWWAHFPNISLELEKVTVSQKIRKEIDTLVNMEHIGLGLDISELLANDFTIEKIYLKNGKVALRVFDGKFNNYSVFNKKSDSTAAKITFDMERVDIKKVNFEYQDYRDKHHYSVYFDKNYLKLKYNKKGITSYLKGDLNINRIQVKGKNYFENRAITSNIKLVYTEKDKRFKLSKSNVVINGGQFDLDGYFINNSSQKLDLSFRAHEGKLSALSSLLPTAISAEINKYKTKGKVYFDGKVKGDLADGNSPAIDINFGFKDASFTDPTTKQSITEANLVGQFTNGRLRNAFSTKLVIDNFSVKLQGGTAKGSFAYRNFSDPQIDIDLEAEMPFKSLVNLIGNNHFHSPEGYLSARVKIKAPLNLLLTDRTNSAIVSNGELKIENVSFGINNSDIKCQAINGHFLINKTDLGIVNFEGKAGESDFKLDGIISQFIPFVFGYGDELLLQGGFKSQFIDLDQLLSQNIDSEEEKDQNYNFKISPWLSFDLDCSFDKVKFRRLKGKDELRNVAGELHLKEQLFTYNHFHFTVASGEFENKGFINAQNEDQIKLYNLCMLSNLDVQEFFYVFENFNQDFITDKNIKGKIHGTYDATLLFDKALRLDLGKLKLNTDLTITYGELLKFAPLQEMGKYLKRKKYRKYVQNSDLNKIVFSELKSKISIIDGVILIPEMTIENSVTRINMSGTHSMGNEINYKIDFPLVNYKKVKEGEAIDESKYLNIYMEISGKTNDYTVDVKESQMLRDFTKIIKHNLSQETQKDDEDDDQTIELDLDDEENTIELD
jgi:hypothetical protein